MPRCHVNAQCWVDCCVWCTAYWKEPDGPCSTRTAHDKAQVFEFGDERMTITANQVPGAEFAEALAEILPESLDAKLRESSDKICFSLAAVTREELVDILQSMLS